MAASAISPIWPRRCSRSSEAVNAWGRPQAFPWCRARYWQRVAPLAVATRRPPVSPLLVDNGCAGRSPDTSAAPRLTDDFDAPRKSARGHFQTCNSLSAGPQSSPGYQAQLKDGGALLRVIRGTEPRPRLAGESHLRCLSARRSIQEPSRSLRQRSQSHSSGARNPRSYPLAADHYWRHHHDKDHDGLAGYLLIDGEEIATAEIRV
jgi:hypothetical protein